jgi:hypothetical protein
MFKKTLLAALILGGVQAQAFDLSKVTTGGKIEASIFHSTTLNGALDGLALSSNLITGEFHADLQDWVAYINQLAILGKDVGITADKALHLSVQYMADIEYSCPGNAVVAAASASDVKLSEMGLADTSGFCKAAEAGFTSLKELAADATFKTQLEALANATTSAEIIAAHEASFGRTETVAAAKVHNEGLLNLDKS